MAARALCHAPAVSPDPEAFALLCRMARAALESEEGGPRRSVPLAGVAATDLLDAVRRHRLADLLRTHAEALGLPADVRAALDDQHDRMRLPLMMQALETARSATLLAGHGIEVLGFKGLPLAVLTTGRLDGRGAGDVDLLVAPGDVAEAHRLLVDAGWALSEAARVEPGTWAWRHVHRWGNALTYRGQVADTDLHWRLEAIPGAHPDFPTLWSRRVDVTVGTTTLPTLSPYDALRHSGSHREGWAWLRTLVDLRRLARDPEVLDGPLSTAATVSLALARETVGLPDSVPGRVHDRLDRAPAAMLERARHQHLLEIPTSFAGGHGTAASLRYRLSASRSAEDVVHTVVALVLPAHAAMPVRARTAWTGVPLALALRVTLLWRSLRSRSVARSADQATGRVRRDAPCAGPPGPGA